MNRHRTCDAVEDREVLNTHAEHHDEQARMYVLCAKFSQRRGHVTLGRTLQRRRCERGPVCLFDGRDADDWAGRALGERVGAVWHMPAHHKKRVLTLTLDSVGLFRIACWAGPRTWFDWLILWLWPLSASLPKLGRAGRVADPWLR